MFRIRHEVQFIISLDAKLSEQVDKLIALFTAPEPNTDALNSATTKAQGETSELSKTVTDNQP